MVAGRNGCRPQAALRIFWRACKTLYSVPRIDQPLEGAAEQPGTPSIIPGLPQNLKYIEKNILIFLEHFLQVFRI